MSYFDGGGQFQNHSKYGRNQVGNVLWLRDEMTHSFGVLTEDNFYGYDGLFDGQVRERYGYEAFGVGRFLAPDYSRFTASTYEWEFLFHGEFQDSATRLYNYGYRSCHPERYMA